MNEPRLLAEFAAARQSDARELMRNPKFALFARSNWLSAQIHPVVRKNELLR